VSVNKRWSPKAPGKRFPGISGCPRSTIKKNVNKMWPPGGILLSVSLSISFYLSISLSLYLSISLSLYLSISLSLYLSMSKCIYTYFPSPLPVASKPDTPAQHAPMFALASKATARSGKSKTVNAPTTPYAQRMPKKARQAALVA